MNAVHSESALINADQLIVAATTLYEAEPPEWLVQYLSRAITFTDNAYCSGYARIPRAKVRDKLIKLQKNIQSLTEDLNDWGGVFSEGNGNANLVQSMRDQLPILESAVVKAGWKFGGLTSKTLATGQGEASISGGSFSLKQIFALTIYLAAFQLNKQSQKALLQKVCEQFWLASRLSNTKIKNIEEWGGVKPIKPPSQSSWTRALADVANVKPARNSAGGLSMNIHDTPLMMSVSEFVSALIFGGLDAHKFEDY